MFARKLIFSRQLSTSLPRLQVKLFDKLPGEGREVSKGLQELLGPLRAQNFSNADPSKTVGYDHFDVAIGINTNIYIFFHLFIKIV